VEAGGFDVAYARFLLSHAMAPGEIVNQMADLVRPGGTVIVEDIDWRGAHCEPPSEVYQRYADLYRSIIHCKGADAEIGPRLPGLLDAAGLMNVDVACVQLAGRDPQSFVKRIHLLTLERIGAAAIGAGLISAAEFEELHRRMESLTGDPRTLFCSPRIFQTWGRRTQ
jgi:hypothetical protein